MNRFYPTRDDLQLDKRICTALDRVGVRTMTDLLAQSPDTLKHIRGLGWRSIMAIEVALAQHDLTLQPAEDEHDEQS